MFNVEFLILNDEKNQNTFTARFAQVRKEREENHFHLSGRTQNACVHTTNERGSL